MRFSDVKAKVDTTLTKIFGTVVFNDSTSIKQDIGGDSLDFVEFIMELENAFCINIAEEEAERLSERAIVKDIYHFIIRKLESSGVSVTDDAGGENEGAK